MKNTIFLFALLFVMFFVSLNANDKSENQLDIMAGFDVYGNAVKNILNYYIDELPIDSLVRTGIEGMLNDLDPYSEYFSSQASNELNVITNGKYFGFGFSFKVANDRIILTRIRDNTPAKNVGFKIGDIILSVNDISLHNSQDFDKIIGEFGAESVNFKVLRIGNNDTLNISLAKDTIIINAVTYFDMLDKDIGYIKLEQFTINSYSDFLRAFYDLQKRRELKGLIIDLRGNSGGIMQEALKICNMFVPRGSLLLTTKGRNYEREYKATASPIDTLLPLVVLIDDESASASEIVAGCLQDLDRATIIGNNSFGKGLVQEVFPLSSSRFLKLTIARYYTPSGRCIQKINYSNDKIEDDTTHIFHTKKGNEVYDHNGIKPDIIVELDTLKSQLAKMFFESFILYDFVTYYINVSNNADTANIYDSFVVYASDYNNVKNIKTISNLNSIRTLDTNNKIIKIIDSAIDSMLSEYRQMLLENEYSKYAIKRILNYDYKMRTLSHNNFIKYTLERDKSIKIALENFGKLGL